MIVVMVPIMLGVPLMVFRTPPTVILAPAALAFGIEVPATVGSLVAVLAMLPHRLVKLGFSSLDSFFAIAMVIGQRSRNTHHQRAAQRHRQCS